MNYLWYYDNNDSSNPQWKLHIANGNDYDYCGETLTSLKKGQGFWANAKEDCNISIGTTPDKPCVSDMPAPPDLENPECITCNIDNNDSQGQIYSSTYETCNLVLSNGESKGDGIYILDKDDTPYTTYCDMTTNGGGWTLFSNRNEKIVAEETNELSKEKYGVLTAQIWNDLKTTMSEGMMFIDENKKISMISSTKLNAGGICKKVNTNTELVTSIFWHYENSGCTASGQDYSLIMMDSASLYQHGSMKFDIWPYDTTYSGYDQDKLLMFIK